MEDDTQVADAEFDSSGFLKTLTSRPGVYRMIDSDDTVIYVGKAKNLKKRVSSYFRKTGLTSKTRVMVAQIANIEITVTHTENEALILENNLIKEFMPRYNILLRDDKATTVAGGTFTTGSWITRDIAEIEDLGNEAIWAVIGMCEVIIEKCRTIVRRRAWKGVEQRKTPREIAG